MADLDGQLALFSEFIAFKNKLPSDNNKVSKPKKTKAAQSEVVADSALAGVKPRVLKKDIKEQQKKLRTMMHTLKQEKPKKEYTPEQKEKLKQKMAALRAKKQQKKVNSVA